MLETPATLGQGETAVGLRGGGHVGAVFGPDLVSVGGRVRAGATDDVEIQLDGHVLVLAEDTGDISPNAFSSRVGAKVRLVENLALTGGLGAAVAPAFGFYGTVDGGLVTGYENPYAVPFVGARLGLSAPVRPRSVNVPDPNGEGEVAVAPDRTFFSSVETGLRVPVGARLASGERRASLYTAAVLTYLRDGRGGLLEEDDHLWLVGVQGGVDVRLGD